MTDIRKMVPVSEKTHEELTSLKNEEVVARGGEYVTFDQMVEKLVAFYKANK